MRSVLVVSHLGLRRPSLKRRAVSPVQLAWNVPLTVRRRATAPPRPLMAPGAELPPPTCEPVGAMV